MAGLKISNLRTLFKRHLCANYYQTAGDDYSSGQSQLIRDDFRSSYFTHNQSNQGSNQYQADMDIQSDSIQSSGYTNQEARRGCRGQAIRFLPQVWFRVSRIWSRRESIFTLDSSRGSSDNMDNRGLNQYLSAMDRLTDQTQNSGGCDIKGQATNFLQLTREQVKNMAQGTADAVKSTLGMNTSDRNATSHGSSIHTSKDLSYQRNSPSNRV